MPAPPSCTLGQANWDQHNRWAQDKCSPTKPRQLILLRWNYKSGIQTSQMDGYNRSTTNEEMQMSTKQVTYWKACHYDRAALPTTLQAFQRVPHDWGSEVRMIVSSYDIQVTGQAALDSTVSLPAWIRSIRGKQVWHCHWIVRGLISQNYDICTQAKCSITKVQW